MIDFQIGDKVYYPAFGFGVVTASNDEVKEAIVKFQAVAKRLEYCKLQAVVITPEVQWAQVEHAVKCSMGENV